MLKYASRKVKESLQNKQDSSLLTIKQHNRKRYSESLQFMREWSKDLLNRESELQNQREDLYFKFSQQTNPTQKTETSRQIDIESLIRQQFAKKVENLYLKQLMMTNMYPQEITEREQEQQDCTFNEEDNDSLESQRKYEDQIGKLSKGQRGKFEEILGIDSFGD